MATPSMLVVQPPTAPAPPSVGVVTVTTSSPSLDHTTPGSPGALASTSGPWLIPNVSS